jgi:hypothetical protein
MKQGITTARKDGGNAIAANAMVRMQSGRRDAAAARSPTGLAGTSRAEVISLKSPRSAALRVKRVSAERVVAQRFQRWR